MIKVYFFPVWFRIGAGFYLNATQEKWKNWRMYDYVVKELPKLLSENFSQLDTTKASISGHSMGGHGALTIYLKNLDKYKVFVLNHFVHFLAALQFEYVARNLESQIKRWVIFLQPNTCYSYIILLTLITLSV